MSDTFEFEDKAKVDRLIGTLHDPAATVGDVLTVQADKSIAAAPGGGSQPIGSPLDLTGCILWLDASDPATINAGSPSDTDPVTVWRDKSTSGYDVTNAAGDQTNPTFAAAVQNGLPVIKFDPSQDDRTPPRQQLDFTGPGLSALSGLDGLTMIVVTQGVEFRDNQGLLYFSNGAAADHKRLLAGANTTDFFLDDADTVGTIMILADSATVAFGVFLLMIDAAGSGVTTSRSSQNKQLVGDWFELTPQPFANTPSIAAHLGFEEYDPLGWPGDIAEIIFYDRALNIGEQREISEYLGAKWALL